MVRYRLEGDFCSCAQAGLEKSLREMGVENGHMDNKIITVSKDNVEQLKQALHGAAPGVKLVEIDDNAPTTAPGEPSPESREPGFWSTLLNPETHGRQIAVLLFSVCMLGLGMVVEVAYPVDIFVLGIPYLICGWPVLKKAGIRLARKDFFNEFTLMSLATLAAIALGQLGEALAVMVFYQTGEFFQDLATERSRHSIKALLASKPTMAQVLQNGRPQLMLVEHIEPGARVLVAVGEIIPLDGEVVNGSSMLDVSPLTGEPAPVSVAAGDKVMAGAICIDGHLTIKVEKKFNDTQLARILALVEEAQAKKSKVERFITRFAAGYTPAVFALAVVVAFVPPLLGYGEFSQWIYRGLVLLVISCPCALVISVPLSYFGGIGAAARHGVLVKGGQVLDALKDIKAVAFDKTGTLTQGVYEVSLLSPADGVSEKQLLESAMIAQAGSRHPLARAIGHKGEERGLGLSYAEDAHSRETAGQGVETRFGGTDYVAGSLNWLKEHGVSAREARFAGSVVYVAKDGHFMGSIIVNDKIKASAQDTIARLKEMRLKTYMLTGDRQEGAAWVAEELELDGYRAGLLPSDKVEALSQIAGLDNAMFVGDGINDAPILAAAKVSVAMGGAGSAAAIEVADAVLLNDDVARLPKFMEVGRKTRVIAWQNILLALGVKSLVMGLGVAGLAGLWEAVFADVGVALLAVFNAGSLPFRIKK